MNAFVDESGDTGFKLGRGSSDYFVMSLVIAAEGPGVEAIQIALARARKELSFPSHYEFTFNKLNRHERLTVLQAINRTSYSYYTVVLDKRRMNPIWFPDKIAFYKRSCELICTDAQSALDRATITIDGSSGKQLCQQVERHLRQRLNCEREVVRRVVLLESRRSDFLQVADMVAGSIARAYSGKGDAGDYRPAIRRHEANVQVWPT